MVERIRDTRQLEEMLSEPTEGVIRTVGEIEGDITVLGAGGKMGPTLARMVRRAADEAGVKKRVIAVARFGVEGLERKLNEWGIETIKCDLLDKRELGRLPETHNVIFMAGLKYGVTGNEPLTWAMNSYLPGMVCQRYRTSRIVAFSSGNVYGLVPATGGGAMEGDEPRPAGEYAMSCLGRERIFTYFAQEMRIPLAIVRLNYAVEMRYGVLLDIARRVWEGRPVDVSMANVNVIWQGDANAMAIEALMHASVPPFVVNVAGPEMLSVRRIAETFGRMMGKSVLFRGFESDSSLLSNGQLGHRLFGYPRIPVAQVMQWLAQWVQEGGQMLDKPTHFENREGRF